MYKGSSIKTHLHISESYALLFTWEYSFDLVSVGGDPFPRAKFAEEMYTSCQKHSPPFARGFSFKHKN